MSKVVLMTDSACDISFENERKYGIKVLCFRHAFGDESYTSRIDGDHNEYYKKLESYNGVPTTSQITPFEFQEIFEEEYNNGCTDLIYVSINANGSATNSNARMAANLFFEDYPEARGSMRIHVIDSGLYTGAYGFAVVEAAKMLQQGIAIEDVIAYIEDWCAHSEVYFCMGTLKYAAKSGRINGAAAFLGNALGIKPLMHVKHGGINDVAKIRGEKNMIKTVLDYTVKAMRPGTPYCIVCGANQAAQKEMEDAMFAKVGYGPSDYYYIGAEVAANTGPNLIGVIFYRD